jgi:FAD/FMN-containing dehydrogenase
VPDRRAFLRAAAVTAGAGLVGCSGRAATPTGTPAAGPSRTPTSSRTPTPTGSTGSPAQAGTGRAPTPADWTALGRGLAGRLVRPADADYDLARRLYSPRYDQVRPAAVAYCAGPADVRECLAFAARFGVPVTPRSGGHSYAGWSTGTGLVLDVTPMHAVSVGAGTATVGAGTRLVDVYAGLAAAGVTIPAGSCPTVGIAGLTLGGGLGVVARAYGLTSDNLVAAEVVTAAGRVLECGPGREPELFWACRGGGGGNFGVVTSFRFRTRPAPDVTLFYLSWPWSAAAAVVSGWQRWAPTAPDPLWSTCKLLAGGGRRGPTAFAAGAYLGSRSALQPLLDRLVGLVGADPTGHSLRSLPYLQAMLAEAGCSGRSVAQCHLAGPGAGGTLGRESEAAASHFVDRPLPADGLAALVSAVAARGRLSGGGEGGISLDAMGGAMNRVDPGATAFVHRNALFVAQLTTTWADTASPAAVAAQQRWLRGFHGTVGRFGNGEAYQNYVDPDLAGWRRAYYGRNYSRLVRVKATYDPTRLFRLPQGVPPA